MKFVIAALVLAGATVSYAGQLECFTANGGVPAVFVSFPDWSDTMTISKSGFQSRYELTPESKHVSRYNLPYVVFSKSHDTVQFSVFRGHNHELKAQVVFNYLDPASPAINLECNYLVSE